MPLFSLLYASRSTVPTGEIEAVLEELVALSRYRNASVDVTGCLIFASGRFAQVLEGEQAAVEGIMERISRDPRHTEVAILERSTAGFRRFSGWALGYAGPSLYVQRTISRTASEARLGSRRGISDLIRMMEAFRREQNIATPERKSTTRTR